jgi:iron complex outermembrane recepter protein
MSRLTSSLALCLFTLPSWLRAATSDEIVKLPAVSINEQRASADRPTVVDLESDQSGASDFSDIAHQTPGLAINDTGARGFGQTTTLRGLGNTPFFSDASAPVYLDDIPLVSAFTFPTELYGFGQVAIYRGPQAASLFGRAGDAGVIQFTSAAPGENSDSRVGFSAGNYRHYSVNAAAQSARNDTVDGSFNFGTSQREGYIYNTQLNQTVDDRESTYGRIHVRYRPVKDLEVSVNILAQRVRDGAQPLVPLGGPYFEVARGKEGVSDLDFEAASIGIKKQLPNATLSATTSFTNWDLSPYSNRVVVFGGIDFDSYVTQSQHAINEEVRYVSDLITGGAFFSHSRIRGAASRTFSGFTIEDSSFRQDSDTFALFGQAKLNPTADWVITPGLRLEHTAKDFTRVEVVPGSSVINRSDNWNAVLPSVSASRHLGTDTDLVFTLSRGFKPGGYSAYTGQANLVGYDAQRTWGLEAAVSTASPESKWSVTTRAYAYRVSGYQIERSFAVPATGSDEYLVVNADRARVLGLEVESAWRPVADVTVRLIGGLTDATLQDFTDPYTGISYSGDRAPYAPSGNAALRVDYQPARGFFCGAGLTWTGRTFYDEQETAMFSQKSYTLLDADAGYAFGRGSIRLYGRNLGGEDYYSSITAGVAHGTPGAPLTWGGELNLRW